MNTVFSNAREVAHQWAAQNHSEGKAGNVFFRGSTIYSYGHHFPMARAYTLDTGDRVALFNPHSWSRTTSRHQTWTRQAWRGNGKAYSVPVNLWPRDNKITQAELDTVIAKAAEDIANAAAAEATAKRERAAEKRAAAKLAKLSFPEQLAQWQAGEINRLPGDYAQPVYLRYRDNGETIETSKGARVSTAIAKRAWRHYEAGTLAAGEKLGAYTVDTVAADTVKIGCHLLRVDILRAFFTA